MTDQDLIWEYDRLGDLDADLNDKLRHIHEQMEDNDSKMDDLETVWLESHICFCGLTGLESSCEHDKN